MLHLSQMVQFLSGNGGPWNCARYRLSTKGQYLQNMLMNFQNHSIPSFCSTHLLGGSRQRDILPNEIVQKMSAKIVMQVDFVENVTTKINFFVSQFTGHTISFLHNMCLEAWGNTFNCNCFWLPTILMASMLRMSSSKNILQHLDSIVHQFQEVVIDFSDGPASQFKLGVLLSSITQLGRNNGNNLFATSHCNLGHADGIGWTMKRLVSHEVMSGKQRWSHPVNLLRLLTGKETIFCLQNQQNLG